MLGVVAVAAGVLLIGLVLGLRQRELSATLRSPIGHRVGDPRPSPVAAIPTDLDSRFQVLPVQRITAAVAVGVAFGVGAGVLAVAGVEPLAVLAGIVGLLELGDAWLATRRNREALDFVARRLVDGGPTGSGPPETSP